MEKEWFIRTIWRTPFRNGKKEIRRRQVLTRGVKNTYWCIPVLAQGETLGILHLQATADAPHLESADLLS